MIKDAVAELAQEQLAQKQQDAVNLTADSFLQAGKQTEQVQQAEPETARRNFNEAVRDVLGVKDQKNTAQQSGGDKSLGADKKTGSIATPESVQADSFTPEATGGTAPSKAEPTPSGGVTENGSLATPISSASNNSIANMGGNVNDWVIREGDKTVENRKAVDTGKSRAEQNALNIYRQQAAQLDGLRQQRAELIGRLQPGFRVDAAAASSIRSQISQLDAQIAKAEAALYAVRKSKQLLHVAQKVKTGLRQRKADSENQNVKISEKLLDNMRDDGTMSAEASTLPNRFRNFLPDPKRRLAIIEEGKNLERPIFTKDQLGILARGIKPDPNCYDVVLHGSEYGLVYFGEKIDVETLCAIIAQRADYKKGMNIRLISCHTGAKADGVAQYIADKLKVTVYAPDKKGIVTRTILGKTIVYSGTEEGIHDGKFVPFEPHEKEKRE